MAWFDVRSIAGLWNGGSPVNVSDDNPVPVAVTSEALSAAAQAGKVWSAGNRESVAAGDSAALYLENPAGSGVNIIIFAFSAYTGETDRAQLTFFQAPTASGTSVTPFNHNFAIGTSPSGIVQSTNGVAPGGTQLSPKAGATARDHFAFTDGAVIILTPGNRVAMSVTRPGGLTGSEDVDINVSWIEEDVA